jgi:hypothetical protein
MGLIGRLGMVTAMTTIKKGNYTREAKFVDDLPACLMEQTTKGQEFILGGNFLNRI